jgi:pentose-5-phosphate-3-epimerase
MEKIKDLEVKRAILEHLHMVMFMSINPDETFHDFKARMKEMVVESFDNLQPIIAWTRYFWAYNCQLGK